MAMHILLFTLSLLSLFSLLSPSAVAAVADESCSLLSAYDALKSYDYPVGLLPIGVTGYKLDRATGNFEVYFNGTCHVPLERYQIKFKSKISGMIAEDKITRLKGVIVKGALWFWDQIDTVDRGRDQLHFWCGGWSHNAPMRNFKVSPQCGCGLNCSDNADQAQYEDEESDEQNQFCTDRSDTQKIWSVFERMMKEKQIHFSGERTSECDLDLGKLYQVIIKMTGYEEELLLAAFDFLAENDKVGKGFLVKSARHQRLWLQDFYRKRRFHKE